MGRRGVHTFHGMGKQRKGKRENLLTPCVHPALRNLSWRGRRAMLDGTERGRGNMKPNQAVLRVPVLEKCTANEHPTAQSCTLEGIPALGDLRGAQGRQSGDAVS